MDGSIHKIEHYENVLKSKKKTRSQLLLSDVNYWQLCRTCLSDATGNESGCDGVGSFVDMSSIHEIQVGAERKQLSVTEMLKATTELRMKRTNDRLPAVICKDCFDKISALYCFKMQTKRADDVLKKLLAKLDDADEHIELSIKPKNESPSTYFDDECNKTNNEQDDEGKVEDMAVIVELKEEQLFEQMEEFLVDESYLRNSKERIKVSGIIYAESAAADSSISKSQMEQNWSDDENSGCDVTDEDFKPTEFEVVPKRKRSRKMACPREHKCSICNETFLAARKLLKHMSEAHSIDRPFKCEICGRTYINAHSLLYHSYTHDPALPNHNFVCEHCGKAFLYADNLTKHIRVHTDERPYVCPICHKGFKSGSGLLDHESVHSDQAKYVCKICGYSVKSRRGLYTHKKANHAETILPRRPPPIREDTNPEQDDSLIVSDY